MMTTPTDTSDDAYRVQIALLRKMSPQRRIQQMLGMTAEVRQMAWNAIRRRYPGFSEREVRLKFIELTYGHALSEAVREYQRKRDRGCTE